MQFTEVVILVLAALTAASGQVLVQVPCPNVTVQEYFNVSAYLGLWYEQKRYFASFQNGGDCVTATYTNQGNGVVGVLNEMVYLSSGEQYSIEGTATLAANTTDAKLEVYFPSVGGEPAPYWILESDYNSYSFVWSCETAGPFSVQFSWMLTREKTPPTEVLDRLQQIAVENGIDSGPYKVTQQVCEN